LRHARGIGIWYGTPSSSACVMRGTRFNNLSPLSHFHFPPAKLDVNVSTWCFMSHGRHSQGGLGVCEGLCRYHLEISVFISNIKQASPPLPLACPSFAIPIPTARLTHPSGICISSSSSSACCHSPWLDIRSGHCDERRKVSCSALSAIKLKVRRPISEAKCTSNWSSKA